MPVICPYCHRPAQLVDGDFLYPDRHDLHWKRLWDCRPCDAYVGTHAPNPRMGYTGVEPLGRLSNASLRAAKSRAHAVFDPLWRSGRMTRKQAYAWLAEQLGITVEECHIGDLDEAMCRRVVWVCIRTVPAMIGATAWRPMGRA